MKRGFHLLTLMILIIFLSACVPAPTAVPTLTPQPAAATGTATAKPPLATAAPSPTSTPENTATPDIPLFSQWAAAAEATTEDYDNGQTAYAATGEPDTPQCGSSVTAWRPGSSDYPAQLTLYYYEAPVIPSEVRIVFSNHPSQVTLVELLDPYGEFPEAVVYEGEPVIMDKCPYTLVIPVAGVDHLVMGIRISLAQPEDGTSYSEIDAVQLIGTPE